MNKIDYEQRVQTYTNALIHFGKTKQLVVALEELSECIPGGETPDEALDYALLTEAIGTYLSELKPAVRQAFVGRYFFALSLQEIADRQGVTLSWVKTTLHRTRLGLREYLEKEGYSV